MMVWMLSFIIYLYAESLGFDSFPRFFAIQKGRKLYMSQIKFPNKPKLIIIIICILFGASLCIPVTSSENVYQVLQNSIQSPSRDFRELNVSEAIDKIESNQDVVLFFGYDSCPYCKEAHPVLKNVAEEYKADNIYYVKTRNYKHELSYLKPQRKILGKYFSQYMSKNEEGKLWLYVPAVIHVKDGKAVKGHVGTHNPEKSQLSEKQKAKLKKVYEQIID